MSLILSGTDGLSDVDGTAAAPAIRGTDSNTGIFFPAADTIAFAEGGAEVMRIDSSGRVGIGTTSPTGFLNVDGTGGDALPATSGSTQSAGLITRLQQGGGIGSVMDIGGNGGTGSWIQVTEASNLATNYNLLLNPNGGNLLVGTTTRFTTGGFQPKVTIDAGADGIAIPNIGSGYAGVITKAGGSHNYFAGYFLNSSNSLVGSINCTTSATSYVTSSDYRLKHDIQPMIGALAKIAALKPVTYKWNADNKESQGFIAHELAEVCPDAVCGEKDAIDGNGGIKPQGIDTSFLVATLTAAIQEQQALITALTTRITALEAA